MVPLTLLNRLLMNRRVSAVRTEKLGKGPVTDAKPHGVPLMETDFVVVGSVVRRNRFSVMLLLPPPNEQLTPYFEHSAKADGGSVPLSALPLSCKLVKFSMVLNESGIVLLKLLPRLTMLSAVSDVKAGRLGKVPAVTDGALHGFGPLIAMDVVVVGSDARVDKSNTSEVLPNSQSPILKHAASADGGSVPLSAVLYTATLVSADIPANISGSVPVTAAGKLTIPRKLSAV